ncbi:MAG: hypothetical protein ACRDY6_19390 [Acidimicrobiia bacterium]
MSMVLRAGDVLRATRADYWQRVVGDVVGETIGPFYMSTGDGFEAPDRLLVGEVGVVRLGELSATKPGGADRRPRHIRLMDTDVCMIDVQGRGHGVIEQDGQRLVNIGFVAALGTLIVTGVGLTTVKNPPGFRLAPPSAPLRHVPAHHPRHGTRPPGDRPAPRVPRRLALMHLGGRTPERTARRLWPESALSRSARTGR